MSTIAVLLALGGGATAIAVSSKAPKNSVTSKSIKAGNVTASRLAGIRVVTELGAGPLVASCATGERVIGGGGEWLSSGGAPIGAEDRLIKSRPEGNGWLAQSAGNIRVYALCLKATPGP